MFPLLRHRPPLSERKRAVIYHGGPVRVGPILSPDIILVRSCEYHVDWYLKWFSAHAKPELSVLHQIDNCVRASNYPNFTKVSNHCSSYMNSARHGPIHP